MDDLLANANLRPSDVVFALEVSYGTVTKWRQRASIPRGDRLLGLARLLEATPEAVLAAVEPQAAAPAAPSAQLEISEVL